MKFVSVVALALLATGLPAQTFRRQAAIVGGGDRDRGRCFVEVIVDGAGEFALRGDDLTVTNLKGAPPDVRRFECTSPIPRGPLEFRYAPLGGRGRQQLVRPAEGDQPAVIRIEDPQNGADKYAFEITWRREGFAPPPPPPPVETRREGGFGGMLRRLANDEALDVCRREVRRRLADRYAAGDVAFREIRVDDAPGRAEWIVGIADAGRDRREAFRFSCYINFQTGEIRSAQLDPLIPRLTTDQAVDVCRREVRHQTAERFHSDDINFREIHVDDAPGRGEWIVGNLDVRRDGRDEPESFSCSVDFGTGQIRSVRIDPYRRDR